MGAPRRPHDHFVARMSHKRVYARLRRAMATCGAAPDFADAHPGYCFPAKLTWSCVSRAQRSMKRSGMMRCRHRSRVYPRSATKCAQVGQARLAWTVWACGGPGSAVHRFALHRIRDTGEVPPSPEIALCCSRPRFRGRKLQREPMITGLWKMGPRNGVPATRASRGAPRGDDEESRERGRKEAASPAASIRGRAFAPRRADRRTSRPPPCRGS